VDGVEENRNACSVSIELRNGWDPEREKPTRLDWQIFKEKNLELGGIPHPGMDLFHSKTPQINGDRGSGKRGGKASRHY